MLFPKTSKTAMQEAMTMQEGFPRDEFTTPLIIQDPFRNIQVQNQKNEKSITLPKLPTKFILISGLIAITYLVSRK